MSQPTENIRVEQGLNCLLTHHIILNGDANLQNANCGALQLITGTPLCSAPEYEMQRAPGGRGHWSETTLAQLEHKSLVDAFCRAANS